MPDIHYRDFAPWITSLITEFEMLKNVELHIIAPHQGLKQLTAEFEFNGVYFHFFRPNIEYTISKFYEKYIPFNKAKFLLSRILVKQLFKVIQPDIVNLVGAENPYYSITALDIKTVPVYVLLQTVLSTPFKDKFNFNPDNYQIEVENRILKSKMYFGTASRMYHDCVLSKNKGANVLEFWFPTQRPPFIPVQRIEFDIVLFASSLSQIKGVEDVIDALSVVKLEIKTVKMNLIGSCNEKYKKYLQNKIIELGLEDNVIFNEYFPSHSDMFKQVKRSRIAVLPNKLDVVSSTIREAMFLEIPVVTYITTGTPYLNKDNQTVLLSEIGDITALAKNIILLLNDSELHNTIVTNAKNLAVRIFSNSSIAEKLIEDNSAIVEHFRNSTPIPKTLLFNSDNFPEY